MAEHVFICYARDDQDFVLKLATNLKERGVPVWLDQWNISPAANWNQAIDDALYDCDKFLIVLSPASVKSVEVQGELITALQEKKPIVPLLYQECRIPRQLQLFQHIDFTSLGPDDSVALEKILSVLKLAVSASAEPTNSKARQEEERKRGEKERKSAEEESQSLETAHKVDEKLKRREAKETADLAKEVTKAKPSEAKHSDIKSDKQEAAKVRRPEPKLEAKAATETKHLEPIKKFKSVKFGAMASVVVILLIGIWWWTSSQQVNEVRHELEKLNIQASNLENELAKLDRPEQFEKYARQRDTLNHQAVRISEEATNAGFQSQLEELQNRLKQIQIQLANKEKELMVAQKGWIFVATVPDSATVKILNIDEPFKQGMELKPGKYDIQVSSEGYDRQDRSIELGPGEEKRLNVELEKIAEVTTTKPVPKKEGWAYLGEYENGTWVGKYFGFPKKTDPLSLVQTKQEVTGDLHVRKGMRGIFKEPIIDVLKVGDNVEILEVDKVPFTGHWHARIRYED